MQLGQRIGASTLYKYFRAFGLFDSIGSDISKAYNGTFYELDDMGPVELATTSFGQRFEISPLQLISAISAICNDGIYVEPTIVSKVENTDTGSIEVVETKVVRQVISKETAGVNWKAKTKIINFYFIFQIIIKIFYIYSFFI